MNKSKIAFVTLILFNISTPAFSADIEDLEAVGMQVSSEIVIARDDEQMVFNDDGVSVLPIDENEVTMGNAVEIDNSTLIGEVGDSGIEGSGPRDDNEFYVSENTLDEGNEINSLDVAGNYIAREDLAEVETSSLGSIYPSEVDKFSKGGDTELNENVLGEPAR